VDPHVPRRRLVLVALLALSSLGLLAVARPALGPAAWARGDDLALAVAWIVAVAAAAWLFIATGVCVIALGFGRPRIARRVAPALPFGIRRLVEIAIVSACVALPASPAPAAGPAPTAPTVIVDQPVVRGPVTDVPVVVAPNPDRPVERSGLVAAPAPAPAIPPTPAPPRAGRHVVVRAGDNLWLIARNALTRDGARRPSESEVAHYWRAVITANRSTLRSGDPSVIFPGEIVSLPPPAVVS
jgi:hypothetical protein